MTCPENKIMSSYSYCTFNVKCFMSIISMRLENYIVKILYFSLRARIIFGIAFFNTSLDKNISIYKSNNLDKDIIMF